MTTILKGNWKVQAINHPTGEPRLDERYSRRINSIVRIVVAEESRPFTWLYQTDGNGEPKSGLFCTDTTTSIKATRSAFYRRKDTLTVETVNSVYVLKKIA